MKFFKYMVLVVLLVFFFLSCSKKDNPISHQEKPYLTGLPNLDSKEYDWIDSCGPTGIRDINPYNCFTVRGCSPDGNLLLIQQTGNPWIFTYNLNSKIFNPLLNRSIAVARWSSDGRKIGFQLDSYSNEDVYCIYHILDNSYYFIPINDSFQITFGQFLWWPGDSTFFTFLRGRIFHSSCPSIININYPYNTIIRKDLDYGFEPYKNLRYCLTGDSMNKIGRYVTTFLEIKNDSNIIIGKYAIPGITSAYYQRISPDGRYLACYMAADLSNTKRYKYNYFELYGLGILDLQNCSSGNIIYRFFPDFTNTVHNNSSVLYYTLGEWSADSKYFYHSYFKEDSTVQIVKRDIYTGNIEYLTNLKTPLK